MMSRSKPYLLNFSFSIRFWMTLLVIGVTFSLWETIFTKASANVAYRYYVQGSADYDASSDYGKPGPLDNAVLFIEFALEQKQQDAWLMLLGNAYLRQQLDDEAIHVWQNADFSVSALVDEARARSSNGYHDFALQLLNALTQLRPTSSIPWYYISQTQRQQQLVDEPLIAINTAINLGNFHDGDITKCDALLLKGEIYLKQGVASAAYEQFTHAVDCGSFAQTDTQTHALYRQGQMLQWMNRNGEAEVPLRMATQQAPDHYLARSVLGLVLYKQDKIDEAEKFWNEAIALEANYYWPYLHLARSYRDQGRLDRAAEYYQAVLRLVPSHVDARLELSALDTTN